MGWLRVAFLLLWLATVVLCYSMCMWLVVISFTFCLLIEFGNGLVCFCVFACWVCWVIYCLCPSFFGCDGHNGLFRVGMFVVVVFVRDWWLGLWFGGLLGDFCTCFKEFGLFDGFW